MFPAACYLTDWMLDPAGNVLQKYSMIALNSIMQNKRLRIYDLFTRENQRERNMLANRVTVFTKFCFSKILLKYTWGPFQNESPVSPAMTAHVKMRTNFDGLSTIENILTRAQRKSSAESPKEAKAYFILDSRGKKLNNFWRHVWGFYSCEAYCLWKIDGKPPLLFDWLSRSPAPVERLEFIGLKLEKFLRRPGSCLVV